MIDWKTCMINQYCPFINKINKYLIKQPGVVKHFSKKKKKKKNRKYDCTDCILIQTVRGRISYLVFEIGRKIVFFSK